MAGVTSADVGSTAITTLGTITTGTWGAGILSPSIGGTGINNGASTITIAGSHTLSGAFASTFTFTNTTSVTFPTSGTLATTATANVISVTGTANEITSSPTTGSVVVSLPSALTFTGKTVTNGTFVTPAMSRINDTSGNEVLLLTGGGDTNYVQILSGNTGSGPTLSAVGGNTNVTLGLSFKANASVLINGNTTVAGTLGLQGNTTNNTNIIQLKAPENVTASATFILPNGHPAGDNYFMVSTAATGALSFLANPLIGTYGGTGINNGSSTITIAGNLTTSGAFASTFTMTNTTTVTFPTSGTLATTSQLPTLPLTVPNGGTGVSTLTTAYGLLAAGTTATGNVQTLPAGTAGQMLQSGGASALPAYSTPTYPTGSGSAGVILRSDGTNNVYTTATYPATTTLNQLLYSSSANVIGGVSIVNDGALVTTSAGVPTWIASTNGQLLIGSTAGTPAFALPTSTTGITFTTGSGTLATDLVGSITGANLMTNGDMQIFGRNPTATSGTNLGQMAVAASTTTYTLDRWQLATGANEACTVYQQSVTTVSTANGNNVKVQIQRNNGQTGTTVISFCNTLLTNQCRGLQGKVLSLSFNATAGANYSPTSSILVVNLYTGTGTDKSGIAGAFTGNVTTTTNQAITTTYTRYTLPSFVTMPSTGSQIAIEFAMNPTGTAGANDYVQITNVKLEIGSVCTPFLEVPYQQQLDACRYTYWNSFLVGNALGQNAGTNTGEFLFPATALGALTERSPKIVFPIQMRAAPTITTYNPAAANAQIRDETNSADTSATATANLTANGFNLTATGNAATTVGAFLGIHFQADADVT